MCRLSRVICAQFQLTAARRRLGRLLKSQKPCAAFQLTAARRRLVNQTAFTISDEMGFNSQPPEGGWDLNLKCMALHGGFNSQPPEGGWYIAQTLAKT